MRGQINLKQALSGTRKSKPTNTVKRFLTVKGFTLGANTKQRIYHPTYRFRTYDIQEDDENSGEQYVKRTV